MSNLSVDELYIGRRVYASQLGGIYNTLILLTECREVADDLIGTVAYVGDTIGSASIRGARVCAVYNEKSE